MPSFRLMMKCKYFMGFDAYLRGISRFPSSHVISCRFNAARTIFRRDTISEPYKDQFETFCVKKLRNCHMLRIIRIRQLSRKGWMFFFLLARTAQMLLSAEILLERHCLRYNIIICKQNMRNESGIGEKLQRFAHMFREFHKGNYAV